LERLGSEYRREALAGDLIEKLRRGRTNAWLWRQVLHAIRVGVGLSVRNHGQALANSMLSARDALLGRRPQGVSVRQHSDDAVDTNETRAGRMNLPTVRRGLHKSWQDYRGFLAFLCLMFCFRSAWADWVYVPSGSMNPTILEGDRLLVDKHVYGLRVPFSLVHLTRGEDPVRGDIVVFDSPANGTSLVKRLIAVPGDTVTLDHEQLTVNGTAAQYATGETGELRSLLASTQSHGPSVLRESGVGLAHDILLLSDRWAPATIGPIVVPQGMYFVLGDNRDNSADSRYIGFVPRRNIVGRAVRVVVSLNPERYYLPRSGRLLTPLR
jgi:signal peptidase I